MRLTLLFCLVSCLTAAGSPTPKRFPNPKGDIIAIYKSSRSSTGNIEFIDRGGRKVFETDYGPIAVLPGPGRWTENGRFFVYPVSRDDDPSFDKRFDFVDVQDRRVFMGGELTPEGLTTSEFKLSKLDTITFFVLEGDKKRRRSASLSKAVPYIGGESSWGKPSEKELKPYYDAAFKARKTGICNIHKVQMTKILAPIWWGLINFDIGPLGSTEIRFFPHAREHINGGCVIDSKRENKKEPIYVCPECKRAVWRWIKAHPHDPWSEDRIKYRIL